MIVMHRRFKACTCCREVKPKTKANFGPRGGVNAADSWCRVCRRDDATMRRRAIYANATTAERFREQRRAYWRQKRADASFMERRAERSRRYRASLSPAKREQQAQDARMRAQLSRERRGHGSAQGRRRADVLGAFNPERNTTPLDPAPLLAALPDDVSPADLGLDDSSGPVRQLRKLRAGASAHIALAVADELLTRAGLHLPDIYPDAA